jgi:arylsulfatase A-like enzyme
MRLTSPLALSALLFALAAGGCAPQSPPVPPRPPDLVLISLDTFRADLLELERADGSPELPTLRRLADESLWFSNAWSPQPFTLPSHMTMLTGLHPETHGVVKSGTRLADGLPTLATELKSAGYGTAGVGCGPWLAKKYGFPRGFDIFRNTSLKLTFASRVRSRALRAVADLPRDRPRFLFAHFYDAHGDWERDGNELSYFSPPEYREDLEVPERAVCGPDGQCAILFLMAAGKREQAAADFAATHFELYRRSARALDDELRGFFDELRRAGIWDDALVVVTADHGEEFGEHGGYAHTQVFRETLRVPLLVKLPRAERGGERVSRPAALEDIAPTLLKLAGAEVPAGMRGLDLLSPPRSGSPRPLVARANRSERYGLRLDDRLLVSDFRTGDRRLFDLVADPEERRELAAEPAELARLGERLDAALRHLRAGRRTATSAAAALDAEEAAELEALGYLQ